MNTKNNYVSLVGRLKEDPKICTKNMFRYCKCTLVLFRQKNGEKQGMFFNVFVTDSLIDDLLPFCKNSLIRVEGKLLQNRYEGRDGLIRSSIEVYAKRLSKPSDETDDEKKDDEVMTEEPETSF